MAPDNERDGSDRALSASTRLAAPPSASATTSVGGGPTVVVVASCPSPGVHIQPSPAAVVSATSVTSSSAASSLAASVGGLTRSVSMASSSEDDDVDMASGRQWKQAVPTNKRERLVDGMIEELRRITGHDNLRHLRTCASRYESLVWKKSTNETEYTQKLERRIQSLRRQPSQQEIQVTAAAAAQQQAAVAATATYRRPSSSSTALAPAPVAATAASAVQSSGLRPSSSKRSKHRRSSSSSSSHHRSSSSSSAHLSPVERDEQYFTRLRVMKASYRDEVALVFRELCRVNSVIQNSVSLRRHESNNLGDFLANLKKIIYLLEQQPNEMHGMIPARKRTLEYLDVVESHIQRKVLPILYRLRHTYSTILRPLVLNYLRNCTRVSRRL